MLHHLKNYARAAGSTPAARAIIQNVSRRSVLKGMAGLRRGDAGPAVDQALAFPAYPHGGQDMPNGVVNDPHVFVSIDPDGTVTIVAHRSEMGTGSRTSIPMVIADEMEADWDRVKIVQARRRRAEIRQPGHRRLAQPAPSHPAGARDRRLGAPHAGGGGRRRSGASSVDEVAGRSATRSCTRSLGTQSRLRRSRRGGDGPADAGARHAPLQGREGVPLHRQGRRADLRPARHHDRQGGLRRRRERSRA